METTTHVDSIVEVLAELSDDFNVPRNVRAKVGEVITVLQSQDDDSVKIHSALSMLDDISNDTNLESFTRTQVWSVASMLEKLN